MKRLILAVVFGLFAVESLAQWRDVENLRMRSDCSGSRDYSWTGCKDYVLWGGYGLLALSNDTSKARAYAVAGSNEAHAAKLLAEWIVTNGALENSVLITQALAAVRSWTSDVRRLTITNGTKILRTGYGATSSRYIEQDAFVGWVDNYTTYPNDAGGWVGFLIATNRANYGSIQIDGSIAGTFAGGASIWFAVNWGLSPTGTINGSQNTPALISYPPSAGWTNAIISYDAGTNLWLLIGRGNIAAAYARVNIARDEYQWPSPPRMACVAVLNSALNTYTSLAFRAFSAAPAVPTQIVTWAEVTGRPAIGTNPVPWGVLPAHIYAASGIEANVYFDNLTPGDSRAHYWTAYCPSNGAGSNQAERWTWVCSNNPGRSYPLTARCFDPEDGGQLWAGTTTVDFAACTNGNGATSRILMIGDSLTGGGYFPANVYRSGTADVYALTMLGTITSVVGGVTARHEGIGGQSYTTADARWGTPGLVGVYATNTGYTGASAPDWVIVNLGINDIASAAAGPNDSIASNTACFAATNYFIARMLPALVAQWPAVKVAVCLPTHASRSQDAFGANYDSIGIWRYRTKRNLLIWSREWERILRPLEGAALAIIPLYPVIDATWGYPSGWEPAFLGSTNLVWRQSNGVHPNEDGYRQMSGQVWAFLKYRAAGL